MKRFWILSTLALVVAMTPVLANANCGNNLYAQVPMVEAEISLDASQEVVETPDDNNDFVCNLFRTIRQQNKGKGSIIMSPISVGYMLGMLGYGAKGETRQQIIDVLGMGGSVKEINKYFKEVMDGASGADSTVTLK